jgi:REP element-mobilizing transposase RayT
MFTKRRRKRRNSLRLKDFDYSSEGYYFITISCKEKKICFENKKTKAIIKKQINNVENRFDILIDCFVIMSDHIHMIVVFDKAKRNSLSKVIQAFKSLVAKEFRESLGVKDKIWQRSFYDHIIRNEKDYLEKKRYILNNPLKGKLQGGGKLRPYAEI